MAWTQVRIDAAARALYLDYHKSHAAEADEVWAKMVEDGDTIIDHWRGMAKIALDAAADASD